MKLQAMAMAMAATMAAAGVAHAGEKGNVPVTLQLNPLGAPIGAFGMLGSARNSADTLQAIGCAISATGITGTTVRADCEAVNASGSMVHCQTTNAAMVAVAQSISEHSYLSFSFDSSGTCTSVYVANGSANAVKLP